MTNMLIFGLGYTAGHLAQRLAARGWQVTATGSAGTLDFTDAEAVAAACRGASHILSSVPPSGDADPVLAAHAPAIDAAQADGTWLGYLSSTGVYGDTAGAWVDETAPVVGLGGTGRRSARAVADAAWLTLGAHAFRLPGIYGPGRSAFDRLRENRAHRIDIPGQVFSRIHVEDIVGGVLACIDACAAPATAPSPGAWNLADDCPAPQNDVIAHACRLAGVAPPPLQSLDEANLSPMARAFYAENRRVTNRKVKRLLGWRPAYPTYREGLSEILRAERV